MKKNRNCIAGQWVDAVSGKTFQNLNPADTRDVIGVFPESDVRDVEQAVQAAERAYSSWRLVPPPKRGDILLRTGLLLEKYKEALAQLMTREMGKVLKESLGDVQEAIDTALYFAGEGRRALMGDRPAERSTADGGGYSRG